MDIAMNKENEMMNLSLCGRLDADTTMELKAVLEEALPGVKRLELDLVDLEYISSAGLRTLLWAHKELVSHGGVMTICNCNEVVTDIFEITGFADVLNFA